MQKSLLSALLIIVAIGGFVAMDAWHFGMVQAATDVSGVISSNTTWTKANSPYSLTGPMLVNNGVTLTIEAGVTVNLNFYYLQVNGTLVARGSPTDRITFVGGNTGSGSGNYAIMFTQFSTSWNEQTGTGCIIENAVLSYTAIGVEKASPKIANNDIHGVGITVNTALQGQPIITNNTIRGVSNYGSLNGIYCNGNAIVANNTVGDWPQTGIRVYYGNPIIVGNLIFNNNGLANHGEGGIEVDYPADYPRQQHIRQHLQRLLTL